MDIERKQIGDHQWVKIGFLQSLRNQFWLTDDPRFVYKIEYIEFLLFFSPHHFVI
jgi:hypothetical protein